MPAEIIDFEAFKKKKEEEKYYKGVRESVDALKRKYHEKVDKLTQHLFTEEDPNGV